MVLPDKESTFFYTPMNPFQGWDFLNSLYEPVESLKSCRMGEAKRTHHLPLYPPL